MQNTKELTSLLKRVDKVIKKGKIDLSSSEDLSIAIMNLISIEEHLFFTSQKTKKKKYLNLLNEIRSLRTKLLSEIIKDYEGEVWCISKHLLATSMRLMEVGTKELKKGNKKKAWSLFEKSHDLYNLFWAINLDKESEKIFVTEKKSDSFANEELSGEKVSPFGKLSSFLNKAIDCCKE